MNLKQKLKNFLKKFYPIPTNRFYGETKRLYSELLELKNIVNKNEIESIRTELISLKQQLSSIEKNTSEAIWANVFHDAIRETSWLTDKSFWPGRAALGYQAMYVTYRILNEIKPEKILELGLGQSTKLISQYVNANPDVKHTVVENNQDWIEFFKKTYPLPHSTTITKLDWKIVPYENDTVRIFEGFKEVFQKEKFDFILVDTPLGADMKHFSRIDILDILPECLESNFVILVDDTDRNGEKNTIAEIKNKLSKNGIQCCEGLYNGLKSSTVICSQNLGFLTTL